MKAVGEKIFGRARGFISRRDGLKSYRRRAAWLSLSLAVTASLLLGGCFREETGERFYGKVSVPQTQEFRWSDGGLPKVFDPARAAAPPDTDAVRALYEGLTDYEPGTLRPVPAVASRWETANNGQCWTFHLREGARWTNGDPVTAQDFVRSWQRTLRLGERAPHANLLANIEGAQAGVSESARAERRQDSEHAERRQESERAEQRQGSARAEQELGRSLRSQQIPSPPTLGVVALDARTLRVTLQRADMNFPALVAHPVFRPVHELSLGAGLSELWYEQNQQGGVTTELGIVTNGAFSLSRLAGDSVELARAESYWDAASVKLERVRFVDRGGTESALAAYRAGEVDAITNAAVEPLAVKLLTPYEDFRRETFAALNYYRFNTARPPFDDLRVRQALASALNIERLNADTLGGATEATRKFLPVPAEDAQSNASKREDDGGGVKAEDKAKAEDDAKGEGTAEDKTPVAVKGIEGAVGESGQFVHNVERARRLLEEAGYPGGVNFPHIRLLVNRNEQQRLVAQAVARMWHDALGVETEIIIRPWEEYEAMLRAGDFDVARRSLVMQTTDEETNMLALFSDDATPEAAPLAADAAAQGSPSATPSSETVAHAQAGTHADAPILTEAQALGELPAIPLHFASSYALVKPYVEGFEQSLLDAPSLKHVRINQSWQPPAPEQSARLSTGK
ncbi:MAG: oligopeptide transport system substrate-binding protein [Acidobacteriota bacterium]|jgi:oligopeptide transport system substrate-binding protein|nr:oligopeptide transport system substrate-binding protein [Acidobacteriota bacterium]